MIDFSQTAYTPNASNLLDSITKIQSYNKTDDENNALKQAGDLYANGNAPEGANLLARAGMMKQSQGLLDMDQAAKKRDLYAKSSGDTDTLSQGLLGFGDPEGATAVTNFANTQAQAAAKKQYALTKGAEDYPEHADFIKNNPLAFETLQKSIDEGKDADLQQHQGEAKALYSSLRDQKDEAGVRRIFQLYKDVAKQKGEDIPDAVLQAEKALDGGAKVEDVRGFLEGAAGLTGVQPFMTTGTNANNTLANAYGLNGNTAQSQYMQNFQNSPFFTQMVDNTAKTTQAQAKSGGFGGNLLDQLYKNNAGLWNQDYQNQLTGIQGLSNTGANAAGTVMGAATNAGNSAANTITTSANNQAANIAGAGSSMGSGIQGAANSAGNALTNYSLLSMLNNGGGNSNGGGIGGWTTNVMGPSA